MNKNEISTSKAIIACNRCSGRGKIIVEYWKSPKENEVIDCPDCGGKGRVVKIVKVSFTKIDGYGIFT